MWKGVVMKYEDMDITKDIHGFEYADKYHIIGEYKSCFRCGEKTRAVDVFSEAHICSEECQQTFDAWCNNILKRMQETD